MVPMFEFKIKAPLCRKKYSTENILRCGKRNLVLFCVGINVAKQTLSLLRQQITHKIILLNSFNFFILSS